MRPTEEIATSTKYEILDRLLADGFHVQSSRALDVATTIQHAARANALRWEDDLIESSLRSRPLRLDRTVAAVPLNEFLELDRGLFHLFRRSRGGGRQLADIQCGALNKSMARKGGRK